MRRGFTLVELMTALAILSTLFLMVSTRYELFQYRVKRAEPALYLDAVVRAQYAYGASYDAFLEANSNPGGTPDSKMRSWDTTEAGWAELGFPPDGAVRCNYVLSADNAVGWFRAESSCDIDHNMQLAIIRYDSELSGTPGWSDLYPTRF